MADNSRPATGYPAPGYPVGCNPNGIAGTGYPYAAPPPQSTYYNANPYYAQQYPDRRATCLRRLLVIVIALFVIFGSVFFIVWLVVRPRLPEVRIDSVALSNFNLSSSLFTGNWDVRFTVRNPNHKMTLYYDHIDSSILYLTEALAETTVPPFAQGTKNQTSMRATFAAASTYLDKSVVDHMNGERAKGNVNFNVRMFARVRFKAGAWRARQRFLRVFCGDLPVGLSSNGARGTLVGEARECRLRL
ncbi:NDR1/HIN1-like protein 10 [Diospyros lotus]|uniref:NDR1/HIN1-like protein 10 n=1 Tax=Diospyros lotus TaxID=55363 RepID=UPI00224F49FF|nr:NDR1/HIN1-like protein 10 [Diospyros lotus]XP_052197275.1 NDR1/HIN1-like protein 10 [Diospyros lotus]